MIENTIARLFELTGLGTVLPPVSPVSGGLMHRMYRVNTPDHSYAVKHLNPKTILIMNVSGRSSEPIPISRKTAGSYIKAECGG